jgi:hypothetical protein
MAGVQLDGVNFDPSGISSTKWAISTSTPPSNWESPTSDDSAWIKNYASATNCIATAEGVCNAYGANIIQRLEAKIGNQDIHEIWYPNCDPITYPVVQ